MVITALITVASVPVAVPGLAALAGGKCPNIKIDIGFGGWQAQATDGSSWLTAHGQVVQVIDGMTLCLSPGKLREIAPGLVLDESRHAMLHGERVVDLSAREYSLLSHLLRNRGAALTRQQLLDEVWGAEPDVYSNVVDLYVHYLRKKFEEAGYDELIQTVRGIGYRLAENAKAEKPKGEKR